MLDDIHDIYAARLWLKAGIPWESHCDTGIHDIHGFTYS